MKHNVGTTYRIGAAIFLFGPNDGTRSLGGIEGRFALDDPFFVCECASTASYFAADAGNGIPVLRHIVVSVVAVVKWR